MTVVCSNLNMVGFDWHAKDEELSCAIFIASGSGMPLCYLCKGTVNQRLFQPI